MGDQAKGSKKFYHGENDVSYPHVEEEDTEEFDSETERFEVAAKEFEEGEELCPPAPKKKSKSELMLEYFLKNRIYNDHELQTRPKLEWLKYAAMPAFNALCASYFSIVRTDFTLNYCLIDELDLLCAQYDDLVQDDMVTQILLFQGFSTKRINFFKYCLLAIADRRAGKVGCVYLWGQPSAGKSLIGEGFARTFFSPGLGCPNTSLRSEFQFNDCAGARMILWEEPVWTNDNIEDVKKICGGQVHNINVKYKSGVEIQPTPVIVTSNESLNNKCPRGTNSAMQVRTFQFNFTRNLDESDIDVKGKIPKKEWLKFFADWDIRQMAKVGKYTRTIG